MHSFIGIMNICGNKKCASKIRAMQQIKAGQSNASEIEKERERERERERETDSAKNQS